MNETRALAAFVANTGFDDLPASVVERMKVYTLDTFAAGFIGSGLPWAKMVLELSREQSGRDEASVFANSDGLSVSQAALVNGVMIGGFESEHIGHTSHPGGTVPPAAMAIAERDKVSGRAYVLATALGYEVVCRIGDAQTGAVEMERGFHNPAANGPFSAAAAVGKLLGFDADAQARAFGIAGSHCGGLTEYAWDGSMTKRLHLGRASQMGLESALLAQKGFTGPATILEGRFGYFNAFSPSPKMDQLLSGLGEEWRTETLTVKAYPCHATTQAIVSAIQDFKQETPIDPSKIERVHIRAPSRLLQQRFLDASPNSEMGAQYSMPFTTSVALHRDLSDPLQYDESVLEDAGITQLAKAITWEELGGGGTLTGGHDLSGAQIDLVLDGQSYTLQAGPFPGSLQNPATIAVASDKFRRFSKHVLSSAQQDEIVELISRLDQLDDVSVLIARIRG